jgi:hypothetical protein
MSDQSEHFGDEDPAGEPNAREDHKSRHQTLALEGIVSVLTLLLVGAALTQLGRGASAITKASTSFAVLAAVGAVATIIIALLTLRRSSEVRDRRTRTRIGDLVEQVIITRPEPVGEVPTPARDHQERPGLVEPGGAELPPPPTVLWTVVGKDDSNRNWWRAAILTLLVTVFAGIFSLVAAQIAKSNPPPNCLAYVQEIPHWTTSMGTRAPPGLYESFN